MKKYISIIAVSAIIPVVAGLFVSTVFAQTQVGVSCATPITVNLSYGTSDALVLGGTNASATTTGQVTLLQQFLVAQGDLSVQPTGYFGSLTEAAVKAFQAKNNVPATGYVGPLTRAAISKFPCSGTVGIPVGTPVSGTSQPGSITITTPVASSTLVAGAYQNIIWTQTPPETFAAGSLPANQSEFDIWLVSNGPSCSGGQICPMYMLAPIPIAYQVPARGNYSISWPWIIASSTPVGQYRVQVCVSASTSTSATVLTPVIPDSNCSQSSLFSIVDSTTTAQ